MARSIFSACHQIKCTDNRRGLPWCTLDSPTLLNFRMRPTTACASKLHHAKICAATTAVSSRSYLSCADKCTANRPGLRTSSWCWKASAQRSAGTRVRPWPATFRTRTAGTTIALDGCPSGQEIGVYAGTSGFTREASIDIIKWVRQTRVCETARSDASRNCDWLEQESLKGVTQIGKQQLGRRGALQARTAHIINPFANRFRDFAVLSASL